MTSQAKATSNAYRFPHAGALAKPDIHSPRPSEQDDGRAARDPVPVVDRPKNTEGLAPMSPVIVPLPGCGAMVFGPLIVVADLLRPPCEAKLYATSWRRSILHPDRFTRRFCIKVA